ncbi:UNVERIFIED_CONTAM: hypothetical protein HDU68_007848 [Siphonaria sp. JEL0065]|nr:hypothetical protein HDU68_007848 [Siphonaria sp. JEL0065]
MKREEEDLPQPTLLEDSLLIVAGVIVVIATIRTIRWEFVVGCLVATTIGAIAFCIMYHKPILLHLLKPSSPIFHTVQVKSFSRTGLTASCNIDITFPNLWLLRYTPFLTISIDEVETSNIPMLELSLAFVKRGIQVFEGNSTPITSKTVELIHLTLSNPVQTRGNVLKIKQDNIHLSVHNESDFMTFIQLLVDIGNHENNVAIAVGMRGALKVFGVFGVYKGVFPTVQLDLRSLFELGGLLEKRGTPETERIDIYPHDGKDHHFRGEYSENVEQQSTVVDEEVEEDLTLSRPPGFTGILPGITFHKSPLTNDGLQLTLDASLTFTYPPALDLRLHEIEFGVYLNRKMITTGLISPFHIEANTSYGVDFFITFNNPKSLRGVNLGSVIMDVTGLVSRALGFGIGIFETVFFETARATTGISVSSQVNIKVLKVKGYDSLGGVVEVEWLGKLLRGIDNLGSDFSVFGGRNSGNTNRSSRTLSPTPPNEIDTFGDEYLY